MRLGVALAVALLWSSLLPEAQAAQTAAQAAVRQSTNIPAQSLGAALQTLARQRAFQVVYLSDGIDTLQTRGASGELTANEALEQLLSGTGLSYRYIDETTVTVFSASTPPPATTPPATTLPQASPPRASTPPAKNQSSDTFSGLQEIVVTARRRDEGLTTVPASITAYTSDFLQRQNIQNFTDYATKIPNLSFQYGQGGNFLWTADRETTIRGVVGVGTTAYYINDTPVPASVSPQTLDLDRIEVLKGPQGTLFGASSMGGNLRFITKKPSLDETSGTVQVQGGGTKDGEFDFDGNWQANVALVPDRLGLDVAAGYTRESGFVKRRFPDETTGELITKDHQGRSDIYSGAATLRAQLTDSLEATFNVIGQSMKLHGLPGVYVPFPAYKPASSYIIDRDADVQEFARDRWGIGALVLNYAGTGFSAVSSTSYFLRRIRQLDDNTEGTKQFFTDVIGIDLGNAVFTTPSHMKDELFTHETRLSFEQGTLLPQLSGIVGVFYQHRYSPSHAPAVVVPEMVEAGLEPPYLGDTVGTNRENNSALFGEAYYEVVPKLTVTLGLRQYWIRQQAAASINTGFIFPDGVEVNSELNTKESGHVPKVVVSYEIGDQGNVYASVSKGFRPGGTQPQFLTACEQDLAELGLTTGEHNYKSDTLWSYELGAKTRLADGLLHASVAAFQLDWSDIQQTAFLPSCTLQIITNAGKARVRGGEVEIGGRPFADVPFSLDLGLGYTDAVLLDPGVLPQAAHSRLNFVPEWTASVSSYYEKPLSETVSLFAAADYSYTGSTRVDDGLGGAVKRQPINMVNGNVGLSFGRSQIMLYGKNLFDKRLNFGDQVATGFERLTDDGSQRMPRGVVSRPRQLGLQYQLDF